MFSTVQFVNALHVFKAQDSYHFVSMSLQLFLEHTLMCTPCENKQRSPGRWCHGASDRMEMCSHDSFKRHKWDKWRLPPRFAIKAQAHSLFLSEENKFSGKLSDKSIEKLKDAVTYSTISNSRWTHWPLLWSALNLVFTCLDLKTGSAFTTCVASGSHTWLCTWNLMGSLKKFLCQEPPYTPTLPPPEAGIGLACGFVMK